MSRDVGKELIAERKYMNLVARRGWEYVERTNVTAIGALSAVTDDGRILLVEQRREPVDGRVIELPAGLVGDVPGEESEDLQTASQRELMEETGYRAESFEELIVGPPSAGITSEIVTFLRATGLRKVGEGGGDSSEDISVHEVPLDAADGWLREKARAGLLIDPKVYTGLYFTRQA